MELITDLPPEPAPTPPKENSLQFKGQPSELLGIMLFNWILTSFTLGLYYPWARVAKLRFLYGNAILNNTPFIFHGTGKELFKGFLKFFGFIVLWYMFIIYVQVKGAQASMYAAFILPLFSLAFLLIIPLAIHGAMRYRLSRTSWRGIHLGYRGERGHLMGKFIGGMLLSIITLGIYYSWFVHDLRKYIIGNCRFGSLRFGYSGTGSELFIINLKAIFLTPLTFGLYYFWYQREFINYLINNTYMEQNGERFHLKGRIRGGSYLALTIVNFFLTIFTFGLAIPWVITRTINFIMNNMELPKGVDFENIAQTEDEYLDATGEDVLDYLDFGII
jgi:uncharacterized membrane protein YjgN (DUF898 family)